MGARLSSQFFWLLPDITERFIDSLQKILLSVSSLLWGCSYGGELAQLGELARLGKMIFIPRSYGSYISVQSKSLLCCWKKT